MRHDYDKQSDRKVILGPIFKYAAIGITIGVVMLTGIVTLERHNNTLDQDLANLKTQLASENKEAKNSAAAEVHEQQPSIQTEVIIAAPQTQAAPTSSEPVVKKAVVTDGPVIEDRSTPAVVEAAPPGDIQTTATLSREAEMPVVVEQPVVLVQDPMDAPPAEPAAATNLPATNQQPDSAGTQELAEIHDPGYEQMAAPDMESFEFEGPERLSHREWVEQQRLRHELWLEKVEKRRLEEFGTRKASHPGSNYVKVPYEKRESM